MSAESMATNLAHDPNPLSSGAARATFRFRALDADGRESTGTIAAATPQEVARRLRAEGKTVLSIGHDERIASTAAAPRPTRSARARRSDLAALCRHLGTMADAGVPLSEALASAAEEGGRDEFRPFVRQLATEVESGVPLSEAFGRRGREVPALVIALVRAAEATGQLGPMLLRASDHLRRAERLTKQVRAAASYPFLMLGAGTVVVIALLVFVLPRFAKIYADRGADLPWPTQVLLATSDAIRSNALLLGVAAGLLIAAGAVLMRSGAWDRLMDRVRFGLPVVGRLARLSFVATTCRTLATLLASGIHLLDAIAICRGLSRSPRAARFWDAIDKRLRDGGTLVEALREETLLPSTVIAMVAAGERSGRLPDVLGRAADFAEEDLETGLKQATSLLEPILILAFGSILGAVAIALLLPLFSVAKVAAGS